MSNTEYKPSLSDKAIEFQVKHWQKNRQEPEQFSDRENLVVDENTKETITKEKDLPIIGEAIESTQEARNKGLLSGKEKNPFGEKLDQIVIYLFGDVHQSGSNPEKSVYYTNPNPYKLIEGILWQPKRHFIKEVVLTAFLGQDYKKGANESRLLNKMKKIAEKPGKIRERVGRIAQRLETAVEEHEDWLLEKKPTMNTDALRGTLNEITTRLRRDITEETEASRKSEATHVLLDIGDRGDTESNKGDIAFTAMEYMQNLFKMADVTKHKFKTMMALVSGNHDADINNHGEDSEKFQRELFGSQIFLQYVGDYALLSLNTNFYSSFWRYQVSQNPGGEMSQIFEEEEKRQAALIQEAANSGKKIAIFAHEEALVLQNLPLDQMNVTHILAGHTHKAAQEDLKQVNQTGENIKLVRVGTVEASDDGIVWPTSYEIHVDGSELTVESFTVSEENLDLPEYY
jgi:hypothetical protein